MALGMAGRRMLSGSTGCPRGMGLPRNWAPELLLLLRGRPACQLPRGSGHRSSGHRSSGRSHWAPVHAALLHTSRPAWQSDVSPPPLSSGSPAQQAQTFNRMSWRSIGFLGLSALGLLGYFYWEKQGLEAARLTAQTAGAGKPLIGGPFSLVDHHGLPVTDLNFRGKWMLLYFGYTFCPDVCPEELEKMAKAMDLLAAQGIGQDQLAPIFISCDPKRDSIESIREYLQDFHPAFIGLTGTHAQIKRTAKLFRLYYSAPPKALDDDETDYLVDHSIFFYLINPDGEYEQHFGREVEAEGMAAQIAALVQAGAKRS